MDNARFFAAARLSLLSGRLTEPEVSIGHDSACKEPVKEAFKHGDRKPL